MANSSAHWFRPGLLAVLVGVSACRSVPPALPPPTAALSTDALGVTLAEGATAARRGLKRVEDRREYAEAVTRVVAAWQARTSAGTRHQPVTLDAGTRRYVMTASWPTGLKFDGLAPAPEPAQRQFGRLVTRDGIGVPLVAYWNWSEERAKSEPFLKEHGYAVPITATIDFAEGRAGETRIHLKLQDPRRDDTARVAGKNQPLTADFSAVGEWIYAQAMSRRSAMPGLKAMMNVGANLDKIGLLALEPPSSDRIPVVLVHGLMSNPFAWHTVINELSADPALHRAYQVFAFRYPSGVPVVYSSTKLREDLATLDRALRKAGNPRAHRMVMIGHSMGGLLTKAQVVDPGDRLWRAVFDAPRDQVKIDPEQKAALAPYLEFSSNPNIERVVFMCTPHRGSTLAQGLTGGVGRRLIRLPSQVMGPAFGLLRNDDDLDPAVRRLVARGVPTSIDNLSPTSFFVRESNLLPFRQGVKRHSVIGNKEGRPLDDPKCSDGVVPYTSAHLDDVESELVVPGDHGAYHTPEGIAELRRILHLHLQKPAPRPQR